MTNGNRAVTGIGIGAEQDAHRAANDITATDHHRMFALGVDLVMRQHQHNAVWCGRHKGGKTLYHFSDAYRVKTVHIFRGMDGIDHFFVGDVFGQRQLYQNAIDIRIVVQLFDR